LPNETILLPYKINKKYFKIPTMSLQRFQGAVESIPADTKPVSAVWLP